MIKKEVKIASQADSNFVIFFSLSQETLDSMVTAGNYDFNEVLSDFNYYSKEASSIFKEKGFAVYYTNDSVFSVGNLSFNIEEIINRKQKYVGALVYYEGKQYEIEGVYSTVDYEIYLIDLLK